MSYYIPPLCQGRMRSQNGDAAGFRNADFLETVQTATPRRHTKKAAMNRRTPYHGPVAQDHRSTARVGTAHHLLGQITILRWAMPTLRSIPRQKLLVGVPPRFHEVVDQRFSGTPTSDAEGNRRGNGNGA
jgi:hypothetical protein